jgi:hypothetical protein
VSDQPATSARLVAVAGAAPGALVGWLASPPQGQPPVPLRVRAIDRDGVPTSTAHTVLSVLGGRGSLAWGYDRAAAVAPDSNLACQLVPLDPGGAPLGASTTVGMGSCEALTATAAGYDFVVAANATLSLSSIDASGHSTASAPLATGAVAAVARADFDDQSFLLAWTNEDLSNCLCPQPLQVQHFAADGTPLAPPRTGAHIYPGGRFALAAEGSRALLVTPGGLSGPVSVYALDADGSPLGAPLALGSSMGMTSVMALDVAPMGADVAVVAWIESSGTTVAHLVAQAVTTAPAILSPPVLVASPATGLDVKVVGWAARSVVLWDGTAGQGLSQVNAAPLGCGGGG